MADTINVIQQENGVYSCDVDISKEQWLEVLQDPEIVGVAMDTLLKFYRSPEHKNTCKGVAGDDSPQSPNPIITQFAKRVGKKFNIVINYNGHQTYWPVPMKEGRLLTDNHFEWTLRDELVDAIREWLILDLLKRYKEIFLNVSLSGPYKEGEKADELYKWQLITDCKGKTETEIIQKFKITNIIDVVRDNKVLSDLLNEKPLQLYEAFGKLKDESVTLIDRLAEFKTVMTGLCGEKYNSKANDERTAAAFLACWNPQKYTFYKDEIYRNYCNYIGVLPQKAGLKYPHYLQLLESLVQAIQKDAELTHKYAIETNGLVQSDLLVAQNIIWQMKDKMIQKKFTWIPFYTELATKLLGYKSRRSELIEFIYSEEGLHEYANYLHLQDKTQMIDDIDPFSFMGIFNRGSLSPKSRIKILERIKTRFEIEAAVPSDFDGVPVLNYARMFFYNWFALKDSCDIMWNAYEAMMKGDLKSWFNYYNIRNRNAECTMPLFWCKADEYIALDSNNVDYLKTKGIDVNVSDEASYLSLLQTIKGKMTSGDISEKTYAEISYNAWKKGNDKSYYYAGFSFGGNDSQLDRFIEKKIWEGFGSKSVNDLIQKVNVGDILILKTSSTKGPKHQLPFLKIHAIGIVETPIKQIENSNHYTCGVNYIQIDPCDFDGSQYGKYRQTFHKCNDKEIIDFVNNIIEQNMIPKNIHQNTNILRLKKNIILQGAPGTGKTYNTAALALSICGESIPESHNEVMQRYEELQKEGRIGFVTFHQSMDYEDFVEGIKPKTINEQVTYKIEPGIFKMMCENAKNITTERKSDKIDFSKTRVFKMSLGEKGKDDAEIFDYCLENNVVGLGWGGDKDFSQCKKREDFKALDDTWGAIAMEIFKLWMQIGDVILISDGTKSVKAIARIVGNYEFHKDAPIDMCQFRKVEWLYTGDSIPISKLYNKNLSQQSIYGFYGNNKYGKPDFNGSIKVDVINDIITGKVDDEIPQNYVLIIDEINRGNVSRIFGELITLLEADKRIGGDHPIKVTLPYSKDSFGVPSNLYIIGTMNTTDRSVGNIDYAVRRRFAFVTLKADKELVKQNSIPAAVALFEVVESFIEKNKTEMDFDDLMVGHSYFFAKDEDELKLKWQYEILPLLNEYIKDDILRADRLKADMTMEEFVGNFKSEK